jgi:hypothetical protein
MAFERFLDHVKSLKPLRVKEIRSDDVTNMKKSFAIMDCCRNICKEYPTLLMYTCDPVLLKHFRIMEALGQNMASGYSGDISAVMEKLHEVIEETDGILVWHKDEYGWYTTDTDDDFRAFKRWLSSDTFDVKGSCCVCLETMHDNGSACQTCGSWLCNGCFIESQKAEAILSCPVCRTKCSRKVIPM